MKLSKSKNFVKRYKKLTKSIQKKVDKQILFLEKNFFYPSLKTKKMPGFKNWWEFRIDYHYRMTGKKTRDLLVLHSVGPHDEGLGKK